MQNARTPRERYEAHASEKGREVTPADARTEPTGDLSDEERDALAKMQDNEARYSTPGIQPGRDKRTPQQKAEIDNNLESKRAAGLTGEPDKQVDVKNEPKTHPIDTTETDAE